MTTSTATAAHAHRGRLSLVVEEVEGGAAASRFPKYVTVRLNRARVGKTHSQLSCTYQHTLAPMDNVSVDDILVVRLRCRPLPPLPSVTTAAGPTCVCAYGAVPRAVQLARFGHKGRKRGRYHVVPAAGVCVSWNRGRKPVRSSNVPRWTQNFWQCRRRKHWAHVHERWQAGAGRGPQPAGCCGCGCAWSPCHTQPCSAPCISLLPARASCSRASTTTKLLLVHV